MLRRCIWELLSTRSIASRRRAMTAQTPFFLSSRNEFSTSSAKKPRETPPSPEGTAGSGGSLKKLVLGSAVVGAAAMAAYQTGYIDFLVEAPKDEQPRPSDLKAVETLKHMEHRNEGVTLPSVENPSELKRNREDTEKTEHYQRTGADVNHGSGSEFKPAVEDTVTAKENELSNLAQTTTSPGEQTVGSRISSEGNLIEDKDESSELEQKNQPENSRVEDGVIDNSVQASEGSATQDAASHQDITMEVSKDAVNEEGEAPKSLADSYSLNAVEVNSDSSAKRAMTDPVVVMFNEKEVSVAESGKSKDKNKPNNDKVEVYLTEVIHAAEERQAKKDAYIFAEENRKLKEKYEKELKDARARELMYAEEAAILDKELNKEKVKAAAAIKSLQEKSEQKLQEELQCKEEEADILLKKAQELAKAELTAAIASEKASQIERIAEASMNIDALCMAFFARSEEARQTHSVHKLALGTLALEDALSKGMPIRAEVETLHKSLEGINKDSLLDLVLSSLPEDVLNYGTDTRMQLNQKFDSLKGTLRHFSLIPAGGGGLLAHSVAHIASSIKMREDQSGHGIESVISKVENYLVHGKFAEAAETLEGGVRGSEAEEVIAEWVRQARKRAVVEQALTLLQSYASAIAC
ncbi:MICOS complex subunit MIC60 isoform X1 [Asparagus officinalis]|uniref:MICOS complex subunit MIC60 isoform X1 n=2 Tax=Asparagus officinalis TaxID=4686 RepID=UPI00098E510B|nr:MICOS complex subunit MIC60 isoform X1 [Asparagus officinalis]